MQAYLTACKLMDLHTFCYILEHFTFILEHSAYILEHSGTFYIHSEYILERSGAFWNILEHYAYIKEVEFQLVHGHTDIRTCWVASSQLKKKKPSLQIQFSKQLINPNLADQSNMYFLWQEEHKIPRLVSWLSALSRQNFLKF